MALFSSFLKNENVPEFTQQEAFFGIACFAILSVGDDFVDEDFSRFNVVINRMKLFEGITNERADEYMKKIEPYKDTEWDEFITKAALILPTHLKETAYAVSCDLVLKNGYVPKQANGFLEMVQNALGINDVLALNIFQTIQIKNRG